MTSKMFPLFVFGIFLFLFVIRWGVKSIEKLVESLNSFLLFTGHPFGLSSPALSWLKRASFLT